MVGMTLTVHLWRMKFQDPYRFVDAARARLCVAIPALLCTVVALTGCSDRAGDAPARPTTPVVSQEIREVDFSNLEWFDSVTASTVKLVDGAARRDADNESGGLSWQVSGPPRYADADGDGDEDAAVGLRATGAQLVSEAWYVWLWGDGQVQQLRLPIATTSRCSRPIEAVTAVPDGFMVKQFMSVSEDSCASGGSVPITHVVGVRHGWPVRIHPYYGPMAPCDPRHFSVALHPAGKVSLYTSADVRSPLVEPAATYDRFLVDKYSADPSLTPEWDWILGIAVSGTRKVCGWARADQVRALW
ncbi:hypothetical protein Aple_040190 [Acrocarpospora pleiomorpha]|uniref:Uncharacterized protein n=1 Tax=Acrocarpospora pleiomorpha TaxID=90975 RepID=A0A5M3XPN0_9ACTN|nr:hypothetical protein [Acrocarpospora pleiomorpha]GES21123.1 hypothetical protein Aple_040190 [Acrocarpospora pleiomorpha]